MTKFSYDLVSLYYRGRSPLKKEDNSFFMCLYTMLVILFVLVCCLVLSILLRFGKEEEHPVAKHTETYRLQGYSQTTVKTTTKSTALSDHDAQMENGKQEPILNFAELKKAFIEFFTGDEVTSESESSATDIGLSSVMPMKNNDNNEDFLSSSLASESTESFSLKQIKKNQNYRKKSFERLSVSEIPEKSSMKPFVNNRKLHNNPSESLASTENVKLLSQKRQDTNENRQFDLSETSTLKISEEHFQQSNNNSYNDSYLFGTSEHHFTLDRQSEEEDNSVQNDTFVFMNAGTCNTSNCFMTATRMISSMNTLVKPCNDFYSFSCGGSPVENSEQFFEDLVPNLRNDRNGTSFLKMFHTFLDSCSHSEHQFNYITSIEQAKNLLKDLGLLQFNEENFRPDLTQVFSLLILFDALPLFKVGVDVIPDISTYSVSFTPPDRTSLNLEEWSPLVDIQRNCLEKTQETVEASPVNITYLYNTYQTCKNNLSEYMSSFETPIKKLGNFGNMTDEEKTQYFLHITDFLNSQIFSLTNRIPVVDQLMCVVEKQYEIVDIEELQIEFSEIDWKRLLNLLSSLEIHNETSILICNKSYFKNVFRKLRSLDSKDVFDALSAILAHKLFYNNISPTVKNSVMHFCYKRTIELMPNIANYIQKTSLSSKDMYQMNQDLENIFQNIREQFDNFLQNLEGLNEDSFSYIKQKLAKIQLKTFPIEDVDNERIFLEQLYNNLTLENNNYIYNYFHAMRFRKQAVFSIHGQLITAENTFRNIIDINEQKPVYFHGSNFIFLSYAFMKKVSVDLPWYIKIAKVGFPLVKTLVHLLEPLKTQNETYENNHLSNFICNIEKNLEPLENSINLGNQEIIFNLNNDLSRRGRIAETAALRVLSHSIDNVQNYPLLPWLSYEYSREKIFFVALVQELCQNMPLMSFMLNAHESPILPSLLGTDMMLKNCETFSTLFGCRPQEKDFSDETF